MSVGFAVSLVRRLFSALCSALPTASAVFAAPSTAAYPLGVPASFLPAQLLRWWRRLGSLPSLCMAVWWCLTAPRAFGLCLLFCHPLLRFSASVGASGWVCFCLRSLGHTLAAKFVQSRLPFVFGPPSAVSVCPSLTLAGQVVWSQSFGPSCSSCGLSSRGVSAAAFCPFGLLSHPLLLLFLTWVSSFGVCSCLGWKAAVLSWILLSFGRGSPSLVLVVFTWLFQLFCCPGSLSFLNSLLGFLSSRFQCLLIARVGWRLVLGYPPSVAWLQKVLPCFSVGGLSACPSGATVPLGSSVLRGSGSSRWGHLSQVGTVFFLSPRS